MNKAIELSWREVLQDEFEKDYFIELSRFVRSEYNEKEIFPPENQIFNAFKFSPFNKTKVVILGQDPYHDKGQANGLCFSVNQGVPFPPSLRNIFKEIELDLGKPMPESGDLSRWADQGVLLLNATLTVQAHLAGSHQKRGWELFTDAVVRVLAEHKENIVFLLWGASAQKKGRFIDRNRHLLLESAHPSPLSAYRGFLGNKHFSLSNEYLRTKGIKEVQW